MEAVWLNLLQEDPCAMFLIQHGMRNTDNYRDPDATNRPPITVNMNVFKVACRLPCLPSLVAMRPQQADRISNNAGSSPVSLHPLRSPHKSLPAPAT